MSHPLAAYAASIRPVVDRLHVAVRHASRAEVRALYAARGAVPGVEIDLFAALLDHPVPEAAVAARVVYTGFDPVAAGASGLVERDGGVWRLTGPGRELLSEVDRVLDAAADRLWSYRPSPSLRGAAAVAAALPLVARLLEAGQATGGPVFRALTPVWERPGATAAGRLAVGLEALRHHRADAHRAAWAAAGLTAAEIQALGPGPERDVIEAATNRLDAPVYEALDAEERLVLLASLGALPDGFAVTGGA